ncbi:MAG: TIM barrel protein [Phototrophicaceae bacterium]
MTDIGIGTYAYAWAIGVPNFPAPQTPMDVIAFVTRCAELNVNLVQIADNIPLHNLSESTIEELEETVDRLNLKVEIGTRGIAPDHLRQYLRLAERFHSPFLRIVVDTADHHPDVPEIIETLKVLIPEFEAKNIILAIENHDRFKAKTLVDIIQSVDSSHIGICLDTVNSFGALEGPDVVIETLGQYVVNLHVKDFTIGRLPHNMGFELTGVAAGAGMLNLPSVMQRLENYGCDFNAILEVWTPYTGNIAETIANEAEWVEQSINYLKGAIT